METKRVGNTSEARVLSVFLMCGWSVSLPFGDTEPYDMVLDMRDGSGFKSVQVKTGRLKGDVIEASVSSTVSRAQGVVVRGNYQGKVDLIAIYCQANDSVYLLPIADVGVSCCSLRLNPPRNGQIKGIRLAENYLVKA